MNESRTTGRDFLQRVGLATAGLAGSGLFGALGVGTRRAGAAATGGDKSRPNVAWDELPGPIGKWKTAWNAFFG